jgi:hypothetical protein
MRHEGAFTERGFVGQRTPLGLWRLMREQTKEQI